MLVFTLGFREMIADGHRYLKGEIEFLSLYYLCISVARDAHRFSGDSRIKAIIFEWEDMAERARNEWGEEKVRYIYETAEERARLDQPNYWMNAISENEFRAWLETQVMFK